MWFSRDKEPEVQVPQYFEPQAAEYDFEVPQESDKPQVLPVPYDERKSDGRDWRVYYPTGEAIDVNLAEVATIGNIDLRQVAHMHGYETPSDMARLDELADAHAGRFSGSNSATVSNEVELSIEELNLKGLVFKGDPSALFGGRQPQTNPLEQAMLTYLARNQAAANNATQYGGYAPAAEAPRQFWATPVETGFGDDILDAEVDETDEDQPVEDRLEQPMPTDEPETKLASDVSSERSALTAEEIKAKRKKIMSRISAVAIAGTISVGGYGALSIPLGLSEHKIWKSDALIGYNVTFAKFLWSILS
jgi:hypothetical protein